MAITFIGIDPGLDGAMATIRGDCPIVLGTPTLQVGKGKALRRDYAVPIIVDTLATFYQSNSVAALEAVHAMPGQGVRSMFTMGYGLGIWVGILAALHIPYTLVSPQRWQRFMMADMPRGKDSARLRAMQLFPSLVDYLKRKADSGRADALLIAEYLRRTYKDHEENEDLDFNP